MVRAGASLRAGCNRHAPISCAHGVHVSACMHAFLPIASDAEPCWRLFLTRFLAPCNAHI